LAKTTSYTFDNLSLHAVATPVACRRLTIRENANDASPVAYDVAAPLSTDVTFRKYPAEGTVFEAPPGQYFDANVVVGYIQPVAGTITFHAICE